MSRDRQGRANCGVSCEQRIQRPIYSKAINLSYIETDLVSDAMQVLIICRHGSESSLYENIRNLFAILQKSAGCTLSQNKYTPLHDYYLRDTSKCYRACVCCVT